MRLSKVFFTTAMMFSVSAMAEENVVVDLSVLDGLGTSYVGVSQPMFPVLPKKAKPTVKKTFAKSKSSVFDKKGPKAAQVKVEVKPEVETEVKEEARPEIKPEAKDKNIVKTQEVSRKIEAVQEEPVKYVASGEPVEVVAVEPVTNKEPATAPKVENKTLSAAEISAALSGEAAITTDKTSADIIQLLEPNSDNQATKSAAEISSENMPSSLATLSKEDKDAGKAEINPQANKAFQADKGLLIEENVPEMVNKKSDNVLKFSEDEDEVTPAMGKQINSIVKNFRNMEKSKIAIYAYNLEDGTDSFKRKRISLNRAIAVRTYLLKQGYKNFSIKVININAGSDKVNTVELEEI